MVLGVISMRSIQQQIERAHPEWRGILFNCLGELDSEYVASLERESGWLPGCQNLFNAFSLPLSQVNYLLLGESPYPRAESANGYAFWDASVESLWSETGLSKAVNRATSFRNIVKMLLHARGDLSEDFSQAAIASLDKKRYLQSAEDLFKSFMKQGICLLNASLVYSPAKVNFHAKMWQPFMNQILEELTMVRPDIQLILWGKIANQIPDSFPLKRLVAEHPYNLSFITNPAVINFFKPMDLLSAHENIG